MKVSKGVVTFYAPNGWPIAHRMYSRNNCLKYVIWERLRHLEKRKKKADWYQIAPETNDEMIDENGKNRNPRKRYEIVTNHL